MSFSKEALMYIIDDSPSFRDEATEVQPLTTSIPKQDAQQTKKLTIETQISLDMDTYDAHKDSKTTLFEEDEKKDQVNVGTLYTQMSATSLSPTNIANRRKSKIFAGHRDPLSSLSRPSSAGSENAMDSEIQSEFMESFVPKVVTDRIRGNLLDLSPTVEEFLGVVLFADISGFTPLSEALCAKGSRGAEELPSVLNAYFGKIVDVIINKHEGDVIAFAGDALISVWRLDESKSKEQEVLRAVNCALDCCRIQKTSPVQAEGHQLTLHCAVAMGRLFGVQCGGVNRVWQYLLCGTPINDQLAKISGLAKSGETVVSAEAIPYVHDFCKTTEVEFGAYKVLETFKKRGSSFSLPSSISFSCSHESREARSSSISNKIISMTQRKPLNKESIYQLKYFIPSAILEQAKYGLPEWVGSVRKCSVIFVSLPKVCFTEMHHIGELQVIITCIQNVAYSNEGFLRQFIVDDKGCVAILVFGLPPCPHQDYPIMAVRTGLEISNKLKDMKVENSIGCTTGQVFAGVIGGDLRRDYAVVGDVVNLSARLMAASHGSFYCDSATFEHCRYHFEFEELPAIKVKGKSHPISIYNPLKELKNNRSKQISQERRVELISRDEERLAIDNEFASLKESRRGRTQLILGEAGLGKSALISHVQYTAERTGVPLYIGFASAIDRNTALFIWRSIYSAIFESVSKDMEQIDDEFLAFRSIIAKSSIASPHGVSKDTLIEYIPLLNDMYGCNIEENRLTRSMDGVLRGDNLGKLLIYMLATFVSKMEESICSIVLEDSHWMDSSSWKLLLEINKHIENVSVFVSCRYPMDFPPREFSKLAEHPRIAKIMLKPLDEQASWSLVKKKLGVTEGSLPDDICRVLREKAAGNPFYMEEMAFSMRDGGYITVENGKCVLQLGDKKFEDIKWPNSVEEVVVQRINQLPQDSQLALKVASVIGRTFYLQLLSEIYPIHQMKRKLVILLHKCQTVDLLLNPLGEFAFKHIIVREVAYGMLLYNQKKSIHLSIGEYYEKNSLEIENFYSRLSYHFLEAEDYDRAQKYLQLSGMQALKTFSNLEAVNCFEKILGLQKDHRVHLGNKEIAQIHAYLGEAYKNLGEVNLSRQNLRECLLKSGMPEPSNVIGKGLGIINQISTQVLHRLNPRRYLGSRRRNQDDSGDIELVVRSSASLHEYAYFEGDIPATLFFALFALNISETISPFTLLPSMYLSTAVLCIVAKMPESWAEFYFQQGLSEKHPTELKDQPWICVLAGLYSLVKGNLSNAIQYATKGLDIATKLGDNRRIDILSALLWEANTCQGTMSYSIKLCESTEVSYSNNIDRQSSLWKSNWRIYNFLKYGYGNYEELSATVMPTLEASKELPFLEKLCTGSFCGAFSANIKEMANIISASNRLDPSAFTIIFPYEIALVYMLRCFDDLVGAKPESNPTVGGLNRQQIWRLYEDSVKYMKKTSTIFPLGWTFYWRHQMHIEIRKSNRSSAKKALVMCYDSAVKYGQKYAEALALYERFSLWEDEYIFEEPGSQSRLTATILNNRTECHSQSQRILGSLGIDPKLMSSHRVPY